MALFGLAALGLWYALGERGGLAPRAGAPAARRLAALPVQGPAPAAPGRRRGRRLRGRPPPGRDAGVGRCWPARPTGAAAACVVVAALLKAGPASLVAWTGVSSSFWPHAGGGGAGRHGGRPRARGRVRRGGARRAARAALARDRGRPRGDRWRSPISPAPGRASTGRCTPRSSIPCRRCRPCRCGTPRGAASSPTGSTTAPPFATSWGGGDASSTLAGFFLHRQLLGPYTNMLDGLEAAEASDLTAFAPRARELGPGLYDPGAVDRLVPWLRNAAVTRVLSLDPLSHPDLVPLGTVAPGPPGLAIRLYGLERALAAGAGRLPRDRGAGPGAGAAAALRAGLRPRARRRSRLGPGGALLARAGGAPWRRTPARSGSRSRPTATAYLVSRASYARGWVARVDGEDSAGPAGQRQAPGGARPRRAPRGRPAVRAPGPGPGVGAHRARAAGERRGVDRRGAPGSSRPRPLTRRARGL